MMFFSKHPTPKAMDGAVVPPVKKEEVSAQMDEKDLLIQQLQQKIAELEQKLGGGGEQAEEKVPPPKAEDPAPEKENMSEEDRIKAIVRDIPKSMSDLALTAISSGWSHTKTMREALTRATREKAASDFSAEGKIVPITGVQQNQEYKALLAQAAEYGNRHRGRAK